MAASVPTSADVWGALDAVRERRPLVQNVTNYVAMDLSANALLAVGASPAMVHAREEAAEFAGLADAAVINIGTLSSDWTDSMLDVARVASERAVPWVLDPVAVAATAFRTKTAAELVSLQPSVVRGNAGEIMALAGAAGKGKGVDSIEASSDAIEAATELAGITRGVVAVTGDVDVVTDGRRTVRVSGGDPLMTRITAMGCACSALVGAFAAVTDEPLIATTAALAVLGVAGERAAVGVAGPGTMRWRLLDELYALDEVAVVVANRISS